MEKKKKVIWTDEEEERVVEKALGLFLQEEDNLWTYFAKGQQVLPEERQRPIRSKQAVNQRLIKKLCIAREEFFNQETLVPIEVEVEVPKEVPREELLASITTEEMLSLFAKRLAPVLGMVPDLLVGLKQKEGQGQTQYPKPPEENTVETPPTKKRPKILLCEFLPRQEQSIREKASELEVKLVFRRKNDREKAPPSCNWCIIMRKLGHSASARIEKRFDNDSVSYVEGITSAVRRLKEIAGKA